MATRAVGRSVGLGLPARSEHLVLLWRALIALAILGVGAVFLMDAGHRADPATLVPAAAAGPLALAVWFRPLPAEPGRR